MNQERSLDNRQALKPYKQAISRFIRASMAMKGWRYIDLAEALAKQGIEVTPENLRSKVSKCIFSADLLLVILVVLEVQDSAMKELSLLATKPQP